MNYMFLKQCVENQPFPTIQQHWLDSIDALVSPELKKRPDSSKLLEELFQEVSDEFDSVIVKHTGIICLWYVYAGREHINYR